MVGRLEGSEGRDNLGLHEQNRGNREDCRQGVRIGGRLYSGGLL